MRALLLFHQGYTDIINCLSLIKYHCENYNELIVIIKKEVKEMVEFFAKDTNNIKFIFEDKEIFDKENKRLETKYKNLLNDAEIETHLITIWDYLRKDKYKNIHLKNKFNFVKGFYENYNVNFNVRFNYFIFNRNFELEDKLYQTINPSNNKYILIHENTNEKLFINRNNIVNKDSKIINLDKISDIYFDVIKLLEHAEEIHCIDSCWACFVYLLDMKYKLFQDKNIKIFINCLRGYYYMFENASSNWKII